jgi:uncharacterized protein (TIGR03067 family)
MSIHKVLLVAVVVIVPWTVVAEAQKEDAVKDEMKKLQGVWQVTKWIDTDGKPAAADEVKGISFEFKEDRVTKRTDGRAREPLKFILNPTKKPNWIDFDAGLDIEVKMQGIYKLEGDELTICIISGSRSDQPPERPTEFKANEKKHHTLFVVKKVKK